MFRSPSDSCTLYILLARENYEELALVIVSATVSNNVVGSNFSIGTDIVLNTVTSLVRTSLSLTEENIRASLNMCSMVENPDRNFATKIGIKSADKMKECYRHGHMFANSHLKMRPVT